MLKYHTPDGPLARTTFGPQSPFMNGPPEMVCDVGSMRWTLSPNRTPPGPAAKSWFKVYCSPVTMACPTVFVLGSTRNTSDLLFVSHRAPAPKTGVYDSLGRGIYTIVAGLSVGTAGEP